VLAVQMGALFCFINNICAVGVGMFVPSPVQLFGQSVRTDNRQITEISSWRRNILKKPSKLPLLLLDVRVELRRKRFEISNSENMQDSLFRFLGPYFSLVYIDQLPVQGWGREEMARGGWGTWGRGEGGAALHAKAAGGLVGGAPRARHPVRDDDRGRPRCGGGGGGTRRRGNLGGGGGDVGSVGGFRVMKLQRGFSVRNWQCV